MKSHDGSPSASEPGAVFLTGTTGFLGAFILRELLESTAADVHCLVRAPDVDAASRRLRETMESYRIWHDDLETRAIPVVGDLALPRLGLSEDDFTSLANAVDAVYHVGAFVNFVFPYSALKPANVLGTREVVRLAARGRLKPLHHVSSVDVLATGDQIDVHEDDPLPEMCTGSGYIQSKYVAEKIVRVAASRGLPAAIYRPWLVGGHSQTGVCHVTDYVLLMLKAVLDLGVAPEHEETVELTPIDFFASAFVQIARQETSPGRVFHFANPQPVQVGVIFEWIRRFGYDVELLPYAEWRAEVLRRLEAPHRSYSILPLIPESERPYGRRHPKIDCTNTFAALEGSGLTCPPLDEGMVHKYLEYLVEVGFLERPSRRPEAAEVGQLEVHGGRLA